MNVQKIQIKRFYKMDKSLQLIEGTNVAALWAHLVDTYNFFLDVNKIELENTMYQSAKTIEAFTGMKIKAQDTAKKKLKELGFIKYTVTTIPGRAIKTTFYILFPKKYEEWVEAHDYNTLRDEKFNELQQAGDRERLNEWLKDNMTDEQKKALKRIGQKQIDLGTLANPTLGDLHTPLTDVCKNQKDNVIETIVIETKDPENTQSNKSCVYSGDEHSFLNGKNHNDLLDEIIAFYKENISNNHPDCIAGIEFDYARYIGNDVVVDTEFKKLDIDVAANLFVAIHGYVDKMDEEMISNQHRFKAALKFENILRFKMDEILNRDHMNRGIMVCNNLYVATESKHSL